MWSDNFTGGAGGGGGGGFVGSQGGGGGFASPAAGAGDKPRTRRSNNIIPATVKQLKGCQEDVYRIVDTDAHVVSIVGLVKNVEQSTTKVAIHIDDQTGTMECVNYVGTDGANVADVPFVPVEGTYGRVVGALRTMKSSKYLVIYKFLPVTDMNELTAHLLEVIQIPMKLKKLKEADALKTGVGMGATGGLNNTLPTNSFIANNNFAGPTGGTGKMAPTAPQKSGFTTNQNMVLSIIQNCQDESGMHKDDIIRNLKGRVNPKELDKILELLSGEGHVYSTLDDDHFKSTD